MLRRTVRALAGVDRGGSHRAPHVILGVSPDATDEQLKDRYRQLARELHPDMPTGNLKKFKEVSAAYNIMKTQRQIGLRGSPGEDVGPNGEEDPIAAKMKEHMRRYHEERQRGRPKSTEELMWDDDMFELLALVLGWFAALALIVSRTMHMHDLKRSSDLAISASLKRPSEYRDISLSSSSSANSSHAGSTSPSLGGFGQLKAIPEPSASIIDDQKRLDEQQRALRRKSQNTYADLREFFLVHDTDYVTERRFLLSKLSIDRIDEDKVPERCAIVRRINTSSNPKAYDAVAHDMIRAMENTEWRFVDSGPTSALVVDALRMMPKHSPADHRITFVEYQSDTEVAPRCMAAVINDRFMPGSGKAMRAVVTGREEMHPRSSILRVKALREGALRVEDVIVPGWVPISEKRV